VQRLSASTDIKLLAVPEQVRGWKCYSLARREMIVGGAVVALF
jgi:hypothetical protein